jgi:hypothetical protein
MTPEIKAFIDKGLAEMLTETEIEWYMLLCTQCGPEPLWMPFESAEARGKWASEHTVASGHDEWRVIDVPKGATE